MAELEKRQIKKNRISPDQKPLFENANEREHEGIDSVENQVCKELKEMNLENMTPLQAMQKLDEIRKKSSLE